MIHYTKRKINQVLKVDFVRFCIVGGTGFIINLIILTFLHKAFGVPKFIAQLIAAEIALFCNFMLHNNWTYKDKKVKKSFGSLLIQFHATSWPAIIGSAFMVGAADKFFHLNNFVALAVTNVITLFWNFGWSKYVIWRNVTPKEIEEIATSL